MAKKNKNPAQFYCKKCKVLLSISGMMLQCDQCKGFVYGIKQKHLIKYRKKLGDLPEGQPIRFEEAEKEVAVQVQGEPAAIIKRKELPKPFAVTIKWDGEKAAIENLLDDSRLSINEVWLLLGKVRTRQGGQPCCAVCGLKLSHMKRANKAKLGFLPVKAIVYGKEITLDACSLKCQTKAWKSFERKSQCLQLGLRELAQANVLVRSVKNFVTELREAQKSQKVASQPEASLPPS